MNTATRTRTKPPAPPAAAAASATAASATSATLAWGSKVNGEFRARVREICAELQIEPDWLMACIAFETGRSFSASVRNAAGSGATGLIQFMPTTAAALGTTTDELAGMSELQQLEFVRQYFRPWRGRLHNLDDVYMAILWPAAVGKPGEHVLFRRGDPRRPKQYIQNAGLDYDGNGLITKAEAAQRVQRMLAAGLHRANAA